MVSRKFIVAIVILLVILLLFLWLTGNDEHLTTKPTNTAWFTPSSIHTNSGRPAGLLWDLPANTTAVTPTSTQPLYVFTPGYNSCNGNTVNLDPTTTASFSMADSNDAAAVATMKTLCAEDPTCVSFNYNGNFYSYYPGGPGASCNNPSSSTYKQGMWNQVGSTDPISNVSAAILNSDPVPTIATGSYSFTPNTYYSPTSSNSVIVNNLFTNGTTIKDRSSLIPILRSICDKNPNCTGFDTDGHVIDPTVSKYQKAVISSNSSLANPQYLGYYAKTGGVTNVPSYTYYNGQNLVGTNGADPFTYTQYGVSSLNSNDPTYQSTFLALKSICDSDPNCGGFDTSGQLKVTMNTRYLGTSPNPQIAGVFLKNGSYEPKPAAGNSYTFYKGSDQNGGDILNVDVSSLRSSDPSLSSTVAALTSICNSNANCVGFNTNGWIKQAAFPNSLTTWTSSNHGDGFYMKNCV